MPNATRFCRHRSQARPIASWSPGSVSWNVETSKRPIPASIPEPTVRHRSVRTSVARSMYSTVLFLHSWVRWLALVAGAGATFAALGAGGAALSRAERWGRIFMIALDVQMLLGLLLYGLLSPYTAAALKDFGAAMREPVLRFWAVEHLTMMLAAVIVAHVGKVLARKATDPAKKRMRLLLCFGVALLLVLLGMPWPGRATARPLFRV